MRETSETSREPCPDRIVDDLGSTFAMASIGGSIYHYVRGSISSPIGERFSGGIQSIRMNAPRTAGSWAVWGGLYSSFDCAMVFIRQKEDPWNSILSAAATGGLLRIRGGFRPACSAALLGGVFVAGLEGLMIVLTRSDQPPMYIETDHDPSMQSGGGGDGDGELKTGWFRGLFGGKNKEESRESETKVLEGFESPTPLPNFEFK